MLTKQNPVSLDQNIAYVLTKENPKTVALYVNNVIYTDDKDISWLYDVAFERLVGQVDWVVCSGSRAYDAGVRLELAGFDRGPHDIEVDNSKLREAMSAVRAPSGCWLLRLSAMRTVFWRCCGNEGTENPASVQRSAGSVRRLYQCDSGAPGCGHSWAMSRLSPRCSWANPIDPTGYDFIYIGHGKARNLAAAAPHFRQYADAITAAVENGTVFLVTGNAGSCSAAASRPGRRGNRHRAFPLPRH